METYKPRDGSTVIKGADFKVVVQPDGSVILHFNDQIKNIDWIYDQREKQNAVVKSKGETR